MRRAALIVNAYAGRGLFERSREALLRVLARHGFKVEVHPTIAEPESTRLLAAEASKSCDLVVACGGDGTVHGVVQGLAGTSTGLGVLPFGTANALARNLLLPLDPVAALETLLSYTPRPIPLGYVETVAGSRWFTVMAGAGPDGSLIRAMERAAKVGIGRHAYYVEAARLFLTRRFPTFQVQYRLPGSPDWQQEVALDVMASRVANLGGLFSGLTPRAHLASPWLQVQLVHPPGHLALPAWMALGKVGLHRTNPWLTALDVEELRCVAVDAERPVYAQVDGEGVGTLPLAMRIVPAALHLLMPTTSL